MLDRGNISQPSKSLSTLTVFAGQSINSGVTTYAMLGGSGGWDTTESDRYAPEAAAGTLLRLILRANIFTLNVNAVFTIRKNGVDTGLTVTVVAADTDYEIELAVDYAKEDKLTMELDSTGSASGAVSEIGWSVKKVTKA